MKPFSGVETPVISDLAPTICGSRNNGFFLIGPFGFLQNFPRQGLVGAGLVGRLLQLGPLHGLSLHFGPLHGACLGGGLFEGFFPGQFGPLHGFNEFLFGQFGPLQGLFEIFGFLPGQLGPLQGLLVIGGFLPGQFGPLHGFGQFGP